MRWVSLHRRLERNAGLLIFGILAVSSIGGMVQLLPIATQHAHAAPGLKPYSALELEGRDIYIRESCSTCHTQQIRPLLAEVRRYGPYSRAEEFAYDRPFLWGSKRTGPDLQRIGGGRYSDTWHRLHLIDPRSVVPRSIMPSYARLADEPADASQPSRLACARSPRSVTPTRRRTSTRRRRHSRAGQSSMHSLHICSPLDEPGRE